MPIGKLAIAQTLAQREDEDSLFSENSWYRVLYDKMKDKATAITLNQNQVAFISLNYDRSLEHYLYRAICNFSGDMTEEHAIEIISEIPIVKLYGSLDSLPWQNRREGRKYGQPLEMWNLKNYGNKINIIFEKPTEEVDSRFQRAREIMNKAERIYILGFI